MTTLALNSTLWGSIQRVPSIGDDEILKPAWRKIGSQCMEWLIYLVEALSEQHQFVHSQFDAERMNYIGAHRTLITRIEFCFGTSRTRSHECLPKTGVRLIICTLPVSLHFTDAKSLAEGPGVFSQSNTENNPYMDGWTYPQWVKGEYSVKIWRFSHLERYRWRSSRSSVFRTMASGFSKR